MANRAALLDAEVRQARPGATVKRRGRNFIEHDLGVVQIGFDPNGYGNWVKVVGSRMTTIYAHLSHVSVQAGDRLQAGDQLGNVGSTGNSTGPHLHFGLRIAGVRNQAYGDWLDPMLGRITEE